MNKIEKKYQIFVSSTYLDLIEERQAAVEAIVKMGHIPAGMELFKAGKSQWQTITKWIDESDIYVLILGGRYGSMNESEGKSYTHLEYEYALSQGKPAFALVLNDDFLEKKKVLNKDIFEVENKEKYDGFKQLVLSKIVKFVEDTKDIRLELSDNVRELEKNRHLEGWTKGGGTEDIIEHIKKNMKLLEENEKLKSKISILESKIKSINQEPRFINNLTYKELKSILETEKVIVDKRLNLQIEEITLLQGLNVYANKLSGGINNSIEMTIEDNFVYYEIGIKLVSHNLAEIKKGPGSVHWTCIYLSEEGKKFYTLLKNRQGAI